MRKCFACRWLVVMGCFIVPLGVLSGPALSKAAEPASHAEATGHGDKEGHGAAAGAPLDPKADLALWSGVTFIVFLLVLGKFAWGPLSAGLNKRESNIRQDIAAAEQARLKAEQMLAEHAAKLDKVQDEVREILAEARRDAEHTKQDIVSHAQKEAEAAKQRAVLEIERARDGALHELFEAMATQVADATEHVLGRTVNEADQGRWIEEALAQFPRN